MAVIKVGSDVTVSGSWSVSKAAVMEVSEMCDRWWGASSGKAFTFFRLSGDFNESCPNSSPRKLKAKHYWKGGCSILDWRWFQEWNENEKQKVLVFYLDFISIFTLLGCDEHCWKQQLLKFLSNNIMVFIFAISVVGYCVWMRRYCKNPILQHSRKITTIFCLFPFDPANPNVTFKDVEVLHF